MAAHINDIIKQELLLEINRRNFLLYRRKLISERRETRRFIRENRRYACETFIEYEAEFMLEAIKIEEFNRKYGIDEFDAFGRDRKIVQEGLAADLFFGIGGAIPVIGSFIAAGGVIYYLKKAYKSRSDIDMWLNGLFALMSLGQVIPIVGSVLGTIGKAIFWPFGKAASLIFKAATGGTGWAAKLLTGGSAGLMTKVAGKLLKGETTAGVKQLASVVGRVGPKELAVLEGVAVKANMKPGAATALIETMMGTLGRLEATTGKIAAEGGSIAAKEGAEAGSKFAITTLYDDFLSKLSMKFVPQAEKAVASLERSNFGKTAAAVEKSMFAQAPKAMEKQAVPALRTAAETSLDDFTAYAVKNFGDDVGNQMSKHVTSQMDDVIKVGIKDAARAGNVLVGKSAAGEEIKLVVKSITAKEAKDAAVLAAKEAFKKTSEYKSANALWKLAGTPQAKQAAKAEVDLAWTAYKLRNLNVSSTSTLKYYAKAADGTLKEVGEEVFKNSLKANPATMKGLGFEASAVVDDMIKTSIGPAAEKELGRNLAQTQVKKQLSRGVADVMGKTVTAPVRDD